MFISPIILATLIFAALCIASDVRSRRIPNLLTGLGMATGIALNAAAFGIDGLLASIAGLVLAGGVLVIPFALGGVGAGDVKMMAAVGALLGPRVSLAALVAGMALGGVIMAIHLARLGRLGETLRAVGVMVTTGVWLGSLAPLRVSAATPGAIALPYGVPLGLGTLAVLAYGSLGL